MGKKEFLKFDDVEVEKQEFNPSKNATLSDPLNIDKIVLSEEFPCSKTSYKYFISNKNNGGITHLKAKVKSYSTKITINFHIKVPKGGIECICLSVIVINSVFKFSKNIFHRHF